MAAFTSGRGVRFGSAMGSFTSGRGSAGQGETQALIAAMTTPPTSTRRADINTFIRTLKTSGVWSALDVLYVLAAANSQAALLNWKNPGTFTLAVTGSPVFAADQGYKGDGVAGLLTASGYNPSTAGLNFTLNSASLGLYVRQAGTLSGTLDASGGTMRFQRNAGGTLYQGRINDVVGIAYTFGTATGHFMVRRTGATARALFRNGASVATDAQVSTSMATSFSLLGIAGAFGDAQLSLGYLGGGLTDQNIVDLHAAWETYRLTVGA